MIDIALKHYIGEMALQNVFTGLVNNFIKPMIIAKKPISFKWSIESIQDLTVFHGMDVKQALLDAMNAEIRYEIDHNIISHLPHHKRSNEKRVWKIDI